MTKNEISLSVAKKTGLSNKQAAEATEAVIDTIVESLIQKQPVYIRGFATIVPKVSAPKQARNISRNEAIYIPARTIAKLKCSPVLIKQLNKK